MIRRVFVLTTALMITGFGPFLIFPGGELEGSVSPSPPDWTFTDAFETIQLETRPGVPYSVNVWLTQSDGNIYVHAGANRSTWVEHMEADPNVRLRIETSIYELRAERVTDAAEFARFSDSYEKKYNRRPRNENVSEAYLFRLAPAGR